MDDDGIYRRTYVAPKLEGLMPCPVCGSTEFELDTNDGWFWRLNCPGHHKVLGPIEELVRKWNDTDRRERSKSYQLKVEMPYGTPLLPCPACYSEPVVITPGSDYPYWSVRCSRERCILHIATGKDYESTASAWNDEYRRHNIRIAGEMRQLESMDESHMVYNLEHMTLVEDQEEPYLHAAMMALELLRRHEGHEEFIETYRDLFNLDDRLSKIIWMFGPDRNEQGDVGIDDCTSEDDSGE